jgi:hypothetical protein
VFPFLFSSLDNGTETNCEVQSIEPRHYNEVRFELTGVYCSAYPGEHWVDIPCHCPFYDNKMITNVL